MCSDLILNYSLLTLFVTNTGLSIYFRVLLYYVKYMYVPVALIDNYLLLSNTLRAPNHRDVTSQVIIAVTN